jgi:hypothetical protein
MPDSIIFETTDNASRVVILYGNTWENHILIEHPEMRDHLTAVKKTIENPNVITDIPHRSTLVYSLLMPFRLYTTVVVGMDHTYSEGTVKTAYLRGDLPSGNYIYIWQQK